MFEINVNFIVVFIRSVVDIALVTGLIYLGLKFLMRSKRYTMIIIAIFIFLTLYIVSSIFLLNTLHSIMSKIYSWGIIIVIVIFQDEIKDGLEQIGTFTNLLKGDKEEFDFVDELTETVYELGEKKTGALICLKRGASLEKYTSKAIHIDSIFSKRLLISIFNKKSVLHDGAVVITNERIAYASTFFPIALDITNDKELGTRHRAALTISKETDSITLIVSEENGKVSVAYEGRLYKELEKTFLKQLLIEKIEGR